ncbi:hypothetical protein U1Q18_011234 [Sarracenia purpurea var. burkii]
MEIDRSSHVNYELERFLARFPNLASVPRFNLLLREGHSLTDEEVVNSSAELFLHPNYTIPLMGCFRSIAQKIVERAVELLRLVPDLRSHSHEPMVVHEQEKTPRGTGKLDDVVGVIDMYIRSGRTLVLHELACLAFCRALDLAPFLLGTFASSFVPKHLGYCFSERSVLSYFKFAPPPFDRIMQGKYVSELSTKTGIQHLLNVVRASYRLLLAQPEVFAPLWDWSCFLDLVQQSADHLVQQSADLDLGNNTELLKNAVLDMRWCGIQILSIILKISDRATAKCLGLEDAFSCLLRWQEFCQDVSYEKAGWHLESFNHKKLSSADGNVDFNHEYGLQISDPAFAALSSSKFHEIELSNGSRSLVTWTAASNRYPFVLTSNMKKSFEMVQLAVSQKWPVLLYGPAGSGKTKLINELAWYSGSQVLSIHMDEQIDGKTLIGSYVCTEKPGEFRWQPGSLTQAVLKGFWVVFEDLDKAPSDVTSILLPLLEGASSFLTGHGEVITVAEGFRLFSTISSSKFDISHATEGRTALGALWRRVMIKPPNKEDLICILKARYPDLDPLAEKLIETFEGANQQARLQSGISTSFGSISRFSLRDLMKWCKRLSALGFSLSRDGFSTYLCNCIYQEAVDIFACSATSLDNRLSVMKCIAKIWALPISAAEAFYPVNKPVIQELHSELRIGRITLERAQTVLHYKRRSFVELRSSIHILERIACSVKFNEPVLLVGETGTGKTTLVQNLALRLGQKLTVLNLSQQSDVADLLGGFKPMNAQIVCIPLYKEFENLFTNTFSLKDNEDFLLRLKKYVNDKSWRMLLSGFQKGVQKIIEIGRSGSGTKRKRPLGDDLLKAWEDFSLKLESARAQINDSAGVIFSFVEGAFVTALRNGEWILLDEVNLAPPETLQRVIGVLEEEYGSLCLAERGDIGYIHRRPSFRIFACMNPATDAGKRDLPYSLRIRFTEYFVDDVLDDEDLILFINQFMDDDQSDVELVKKIVHFYKAAKKESEERLQDGANQKPQYSLRSLYRALEYTKKARRKFGFLKALYDGFCMFFLTLLDEPSAKLMNKMISSYLLGGKIPSHVPFDSYLIVRGNSRLDILLEDYVLTKSVKEHLRNLARAIFVGRYPVLLQGPTSSGKTSLVQYLAAITGHDFVRVNNHEHTDLQEYLGSYITDSSGRLTFHEGVLVKAVRKGYWIVLDELNLAPSDVLEALNRLLDDNRELFIPELHETVRAHPDFMLFATQNPPTFYGGRKMLSRAFRNRFVEIHVDEIPEVELCEILEKRCKIPESYARKMVEVMKELQLHRQSSKVFAGKHGFITPRDLFRWANRFRTFGNSYDDLAKDGYFLLAERLRDEYEKTVVQEVLERQLRVKLAADDLYKQDPAGREKFSSLLKCAGVPQNLGRIGLTDSMWRLYLLIERCYKMREPVLLVGETGGGKTTVCQLLSIMLGSKLHILNCHQYTETSDFLGGFYPVRERSRIASEFKTLCEQLMLSNAFVHFPGAAKISADIGQASSTIDQVAVIVNGYRHGLVSHPDVRLQDLVLIEQLNLDIAQLHQKWQTIFMWQDGPLVQAMKNGDLLLVDEISLADDSVLERLNSVLEPERKLSLAEKGGSDLEKITAHPNFFLLATMNPGGDYGKKELSPALRNRFTEIWVPPINDRKELRAIALKRLSNLDQSYLVDPILNFWEVSSMPLSLGGGWKKLILTILKKRLIILVQKWFNQLQTGRTLTVRDLLSWIDFIDATAGNLQSEDSFLHGAFLVLLDGLSLGSAISRSDVGELRERCLLFLLQQLKIINSCLGNLNIPILENYGWSDLGSSVDVSRGDNMQCDSLFGIHPFYIPKGACMASYIIGKAHDDELHVVQQLEEMYQMLLGRFEHEKKKLEGVLVTTKHAFPFSNLAACCVFSPDMLCRRAGFESWQDTLPISDNTSFFLDMELLQELSQIVLVDAEELQLALSNLSDILGSALNFSLNFSSRPPTHFLPHQKILWSLDALTTVNAGKAKISSFVLEMWFSWHSFLWNMQSILVKNFSRMDGNEVPLPHMLFRPVQLETVDQILKSTFAIKDYSMHCLEIRVASSKLWQSRLPATNMQNFLLSTARSLFQQIIFAHRKSFDADKYAAIKSIICSSQKNMITQDNLEVVLALFTSSSHYGLASLVDYFIKPVLGELYPQCPSTDILYNLGCAWVRVGGLRYHLLITFDDLDPAMKHSCKYLKLVEKIALFELENEVRKESAYLAGCLSWRETDKQRIESLENFKAECKRIKQKIVYRSDPGKFIKLKFECDEFLKLVATSIGLIKDVVSMDKQQIVDQIHNWQETATCFIDRLSNEYSAYIDIIQPVQVAIYEMKLGLSLILSGAMQKKLLGRIGQDDIERILETIYLFMRFPRAFASEPVSVNLKYGLAKFPSCDINFPVNIWGMEMNWLENLVTSPTDVNPDKVSGLQLKVAIHHNILVRVAHSVAVVQLMDNASFALLDKIFDEFASLWMNMKVKVKTRQDHEAQQFKFKPRAFKMENIIEIDLSTLVGSLPNETLSEWQDSISEEVAEKKAEEEYDSLEEEWNLMPDSIMNNMVHIHNQLFGSMDLFKIPSIFKVSDAERLSSFVDSYTLGLRMIKGLDGFLSSSLDAKLVPEHLFRLCLEHEQRSNLYHQSAHAYNFYKDSNAPVMAMMVEPVTILQERIIFLLNEWDDHPVLQKILDVIEMILAIPLSTPLAKFLLNRIRVLEETVSKFPLSGKIVRFGKRKLEFESWPALLDEVQIQFEINAGNLWYPLYSVLQSRHSADIADLEEFIQTSCIGQFRKRLQLLFAFHGHISTGICRGSYVSTSHMENVKILYNIFGFYVQYLPIVLDHIEGKRKTIEMELKELLKLCRWEIPENYFSLENSRRTRQKLKKLIQKYTDLLQHPIMLIINQEAPQRGLQTQSGLQGPKLLPDSFDKNTEMLNVACDQTLFRDNDRSTWYIGWKKKVDYVLQNLLPERKPEFEFSYFSVMDAKVVGSIIRPCLASQPICIAYQEESKQVWCTIESICRTAIDCSDLWKDENKNLGKRRALVDLLKLLDSCGLSKHRSPVLEDQFKSNQSNWWLMKPSYDMKHLLLRQGARDSFVALDKPPSLPVESLDREWETANQYYFRSIASVHLLQQICLNFHKDITLEQVNRSGSFLDHLIVVQQEQRAAAYEFSGQLTSFRKCLSLLENLFSSSLAFDNVTSSECSFAQNQHATFNYMWQQKQLFDSLCSMLPEECLLLKTVESSHFSSCQIVKAAASRVRVFVEKFIPDFQKSKDLLDSLLIGHDRVVTSLTTSLHPYVLSKQMEQLVLQNLQMIKEFQKDLCAFRLQDEGRSSVKEALLGHFDDILKKVSLMAQDYNCDLQERNDDDDTSLHSEKIYALEAAFNKALKETYKYIGDAFHNIGFWNSGHTFSAESLGNITVWKTVFKSYVSNLQLDVICDAVCEAVDCAGKLLNYCGKRNPHVYVLVGTQLKDLYSLVDLILTFGDSLLHEFVVVHKTVSIITHVLANIFASLYSKGFGICNEDPWEESSLDKTKDAKGTGMGEGAGQNDVSDQINDEDQLLGTSEKLNDEQDDLSEVPSKNDKGLEMEEDFAADTFSISEESGDDGNEDSQDVQLESAMGKTGVSSEIIDEKLWDKDDEENPNNTKEKYESGPSVKDRDSSGRELRAKEDSESAIPADEDGEFNQNEFDKQDGENANECDPENAVNKDDMNFDKEEVVADHAGLRIDEPNQGSDDVEMDEQEEADTMQDSGPEELDESDKIKKGEEENNKSMDENLEDLEAEQLGGNSETDGMENTKEEAKEMDSVVPKKDTLEPSTPDITIDGLRNAESATQLNGDSHAADLRDVAPEEVGAKWSNSNDIQNNLAPMKGLHNDVEIEITVPDSSKSGRMSDKQPQSQLPQHDSSSCQRIEPNPCRNVGDALDDWKERVKVSLDLQEKKIEAPHDMIDETADEFGYSSEFDKGTAQALGPATFEQIDKNINVEKHGEDGKTMDREDLNEMEIEKQDSEIFPIRSFPSNLTEKIKPQVEIQHLEEPQEESQEIHSHNESDLSLSESLVSLKRSYMAEGIDQLHKLSLVDGELGKSHNIEELSGDVQDNATVLWRRYELSTTRLSQELAEQLRLVMEPTLASKLQGDYKTGKRINMKKVIPYIASHYRKDKIWLRRTRPNKRDYQVVIAVDDSRSMSESHCGDVAIEALVTVCRAMSQLEVGNLAVASFGKKGNIRLLHEFDQQFTGEAGVKMISSLTFKQENTIVDEPMVDLLKYVNNMLDVAVANARLPSGQNPLQQLVLIIADGRFHEKENLKRCVRDVLSRKRMVAFLLLDSPQESIMDLMEASFEGGNIKFAKYLDSFPFPYYIVLRNIEALPRTLADLLRQWFELMRYSRD